MSEAAMMSDVGVVMSHFSKLPNKLTLSLKGPS